MSLSFKLAVRAPRPAILLALLLASLLASPSPPVQAQGGDSLSGRVQGLLRLRMPASGEPPGLAAGGRAFRASPLVPCFYEARGLEPAWSGDRGLSPQARDLAAALAAAGEDGLRPADYHAAEIRRRLESLPSPPPPEELAELDLLLSDAFLRLASHLRDGRAGSGEISSDCARRRSGTDLAGVLESALAGGRVRQALAELAPPHPGYQALKTALARLRQTAAQGGWPTVPAGPTLRLDDRDERVAALRDRLAATGEAPPLPPADPALFDPPLEEAVVAFQRRHGLVPDGLVGPHTLEELNTPAGERLRQVELNLERWRWLPGDLGRRHVLVNVAGFRLDAVEEGRPVLSMKVIVGKPYTRTPTFSSAIDRVVVNPSWYVPKSITREVLDRERRQPGYMGRSGFYWSDGRLIQRPGPSNALGRIKFLFPNRYNVYLHDTPTPSLFERTVRTFSHGCMRIEKPLDFAAWVLAEENGWTRGDVQTALDTGRTRTLRLSDAIPVHIVYFTAWVDQEGVLQFQKDVYDRDETLREGLEE